LRIIYRSGVTGHIDTGKHALRAMLRDAQPSTPKWISKKEWLALGKPHYLDNRIVATLEDGATWMYAIESTKEISPQPTQGGVAYARKLWQALPTALREINQLLIVREGRSHKWRRSFANPRLHGWTLAKKKRPAKPSSLSGLAGVLDDWPSPNSIPVKPGHAKARKPNKAAVVPAVEEKVRLKIGIWS
jgi:hypothetical protein